MTAATPGFGGATPCPSEIERNPCGACLGLCVLRCAVADAHPPIPVEAAGVKWPLPGLAVREGRQKVRHLPPKPI